MTTSEHQPERARASHWGEDYEAQSDWEDLTAAMVEVDRSEVPALMARGVEVWTYGYGWDQDMDGFTVLGPDDLWAFQGPEADPGVVDSWAPFAVPFEAV